MSYRSGVSDKDIEEVKDLVDQTMQETPAAEAERNDHKYDAEKGAQNGKNMPVFVANPSSDEIQVANPLTGKLSNYQKKNPEATE